jgi:mannose-1-phosphate guanylyltransferase
LKAILLAAGFGTRLKPITDHTPKCLVLIHGKPLLQIWVENLFAAGVKSFLINTHYLNEKVENFIHLNLSKYDIKIAYEPELLGTAGTLFSHFSFFENNDGLLIHCDNFIHENLSNLISQHYKRPKVCEMTMLSFKTNNPKSCGVLKVDENNIVIDFFEKSQFPPSNLANAAVYVLSKDFLINCKNNYSDLKDFSTEIIPKFLNKIYSYETKKFLIDIGSVEAYNEANLLINKP